MPARRGPRARRTGGARAPHRDESGEPAHAPAPRPDRGGCRPRPDVPPRFGGAFGERGRTLLSRLPPTRRRRLRGPVVGCHLAAGSPAVPASGPARDRPSSNPIRTMHPRGGTLAGPRCGGSSARLPSRPSRPSRPWPPGAPTGRRKARRARRTHRPPARWVTFGSKALSTRLQARYLTRALADARAGRPSHHRRAPRHRRRAGALRAGDVQGGAAPREGASRPRARSDVIGRRRIAGAERGARGREHLPHDRVHRLPGALRRRHDRLPPTTRSTSRKERASATSGSSTGGRTGRSSTPRRRSRP